MIDENYYENKDFSNVITIENKSRVKLHNLEPNKSMVIKVDKHGVPLDKNWRRRLRDSKIDNCIKILKTNIDDSI